MSQATQGAIAELRKQIDAVWEENTRLGTEIDKIRDLRRDLKDKARGLEKQIALLRAVENNPDVIDAVAPGATVEMDAGELLQVMAAAHAKKK